MFVVSAQTKFIDEYEYFHFIEAKVFLNFSLQNFLDLIEAGDIQYDIRIGLYRSGKNIGKQHDHGSGFRISKNKIHLLYESVLDIK